MTPTMKNKKPYQFHSSTHRGNYTYQLVGTLRSKQLKRHSKYSQHYYQLLLTCESHPQVTKIFVFKSKLTNPTIWPTLEADQGFSKRYLLKCRNYQGYYYLVDWEKLSNEEIKNDYERPR